MTSYSRYNDSDMEILREDTKLVIKNKATGRIVEVENSDDLTSHLDFDSVKPKVSGVVFVLYCIVSSCAIAGMMVLGVWWALSVDISRIPFVAWIVLATYSTVQILFHEASHYLVFLSFGRRPDSVGFKMNYYVFPAFYVRMNDVHLLTRPDKYVLHTVGITVNAIVSLVGFGIVQTFSMGESARFVVAWYAVAMSYNCLPVLNSDGFKALLAITGENERRHFSDNPLWIRGIVVVGYIIVFLYTARIAVAVIRWFT